MQIVKKKKKKEVQKYHTQSSAPYSHPVLWSSCEVFPDLFNKTFSSLSDSIKSLKPDVWVLK